MRAIRDERTNVELTLVGDLEEERTLPAQAIKAFDPGLGQAPDEAQDAMLTRWRPTDGERKAIANAAEVEIVLHTHPERHPPISVAVGEPPDDVTPAALMTVEHAERAAIAWWRGVSERWTIAIEASAKGEEARAMPTAEEVVDLWHRCLADVGQAIAIEQRGG